MECDKMTAITHHTPDALLAAYAAGNLPQPFAVAVATHVSMCIECRAALEAHQAVGGAVLDSVEMTEMSGELKARVLAMLDTPVAPQASKLWAVRCLSRTGDGGAEGQTAALEEFGNGCAPMHTVSKPGRFGAVALYTARSGRAGPQSQRLGADPGIAGQLQR